MSSLHLDCGESGVGMGVVLGSCVVVSSCSIRSNLECSPLVVDWTGEHDWNSITVIDTCHTSSCRDCLLPLVSLADPSFRSPNPHSSQQSDRTDRYTPSVSIMGSSIEFRDAELIFGTGPLIGSLAWTGIEAETESVRTSLVGCVLANMTSPCKQEGRMVGSWFAQSIVGCVVSSCSNHLYGTSIRSLNGGGSLLTLNSSFVSCLVDSSYENKPFTTRTVLSIEQALYSFKLCTFKECTAPEYLSGGALSTNVFDLKADVQIESCSFESCSAIYGTAGAILLSFESGSTNKLILKSSSFTSCSAASVGSLYLYRPGASTVSECAFIDSEATQYGGAIGFFSLGSCDNWRLHLKLSLPELSCKRDIIKFRWRGHICLALSINCTAASGYGRVMYFHSTPYPTIDSTTVSNCASSSEHFTSLIYLNETNTDLGEVLSIFPTQLALTALTAEVTETTADVEVTLDKEVSGTLLVVVSNVEGERQEEENGIPNIGRVLGFPILTSSSGSCSVSIGENDGLLQTPLSDYSIVAAFIPSHVVSFTKAPIFGIPKKRPSLTSAVCSLDASHTKATVDFEGRDFEDGQYTMTLHDGSSFEVELSTDVDGKSTGSKDLGVISGESVWKEGSVWIVKEMKSVSDTTQSIDIDHPVSFTIPTVARLSGIDVSELDISSEGEWKVTLSFSSVKLEKGTEYTLILIGQDSDGEELTRKMTTSSSGEIQELDEVLYPFETDEDKRAQQMKFGVLYKVTSLQATGRLNSVQVGSVGVQMPVEPVRLRNIEVDDETETTVGLLVTGSGFVPKETYTVEVSGVATGSGSSNAHARTFIVVASDATSASSPTLLLSSSSDSTSLRFGQTYTVTKIDNGTDSGIVVGTPSFSTPELPPPTPHLTSAVCSLDASHTKATVDFEGRDFENGQYKMTRQDESSFEVELSTDVDGTSSGSMDLGVIREESLWKEGGTWIVKKVMSVSTPELSIDITHPIWFTIPTVARLSGIEVSELDISSEGEWKVRLSFSSVKLESGTEYTLTLIGQDSDGEELTRKMATTSSGAIGELDEVLYPFETDEDKRAQQMKFGVLYKVTSLQATGRLNSVQVGSVGVQMPVEPVRLTNIEVDDETETTVRLLVTGSGFVPKETYTVEVTRVTSASIELTSQGILMSIALIGEHLPSGSTFDVTLNNTITIPVSFTSNTKGKSEVVMLGLDGGLAFGSTYSITDVSSGGLKIIADSISISTPPKPSELILCVCSDDADDPSTIWSGADVSTCLKMERAWNLAEGLSIANTMMRIVKPASLSTRLVVSSLAFKLTSGNMDQSLLSLSQPSSDSNSDASLLSITNGECGLTLLTIRTSSSSSFVFISAESSTITIQTCSIEGTDSADSSSDEMICGWNTGFLHFIDSNASLSSVTLKGLGSGGIVQKGGELTIKKGEFSDNGPTNSLFPSARRNIHCEGEGTLTIDSLAKGDGTEEDPSAWIDADGCTLTGKKSVVSSPLFVPTLDSDTSWTNLDTSTNTMDFTVRGETLVPCGLRLEVFERDCELSSKGRSVVLALSSLSTSAWTSTEIVGEVDVKSSLSSLNASLEWRACLSFGNGRTTPNSFVFASASPTGKGSRILVADGGSASIGECGGEELPCVSVWTGQMVGKMKMEEWIDLRIVGSAGMGGSFWMKGKVGLRISSSSSLERSRVVIDGSSLNSSDGIVSISSATVEVSQVDVVVVGSSEERSWCGYVFVVESLGTLEVKSVEVIVEGRICVGLGMVTNGLGDSIRL
ncbi:hypothetical protein BLNAU_16772 [Blattamonas nauphoetae]|uniref:Uncharacterized protein n=1 Tax=Blattamonas nauphoetae TaxID=2049346 RepID=A0ABQ9X821_9EUKA|nr:hypothetical protein BLNAU_16772 [Blattamonas nauphoetae]